MGSTLRLQQLLGTLGYLPVTFTASGATPTNQDGTATQHGTFSWRWPHPSPHLVALWKPGAYDVITKGAVMSFEKQNHLAVDGVAGPNVWKRLLADQAAHHTDPSPYAYVLVTKTLPERLTLWVDGTATYHDIPVNTGLPGAQTTDGTFPVFEHVAASNMKGTNPDGTTYNDKNVPWASFFDRGEALHGFVRATYGSPQSNGCVEMAIKNAAKLWPSTPIGTLVTITGPDAT